jgi:hypothetical protein
MSPSGWRLYGLHAGSQMNKESARTSSSSTSEQQRKSVVLRAMQVAPTVQKYAGLLEVSVWATLSPA